ncbi:MAG: ABC transporter permease [Pseudorhodoplanes sp.]
MNAKLLQRSIGIVIVGLIILMAVFAPWLATHGPNSSSASVIAPASAENWLGTDYLGRDVYSRVVYGARVSLVIGLAAAMVGMIIGIPIGLLSGYARGSKVDIILVQAIDIFIALPAIILALIMTSVLGASIPNLILVIGLLKWPIVARLVRGQVLNLREQAFVEAARAVGCTTARILARHIAPNMMGILMAQFAIITSTSIFTSASLGFLGLGLPPPTPDWGGMVQEGFDYLFLNPLISLAPGAAVSLTVMGFYLIGQTYD